MVLLWSALASRQVTLLTHVLHQMPRVLIGSTWITYLRNHDDIGWAITDSDAAVVGENGFLHRQFLNNFSNGTFPGSFAKGAFFKYNPVTQDARISGTTASLAGLESALAKKDDYEIDLAIRRILLLHSIIMSYGGIPPIYMGDELGLFSDRSYLDNPAKAKYSRWMHRPPMDWTKASCRHDPISIVGRIYQGLLRLICARKSAPILHSFGLIQPMWTDNEHILALSRRNPSGHLLVLANFHERAQSVKADLLQYAELGGNVYNLLALTTPLKITDRRIYLEPYESLWLVGDD